MNRTCSFVALWALISSCVLPLSGASIKLAWDENVEPNVVAYNLYFGETNAPAIKLATAANSVNVPDLLPGKTYFFYVTAVADSGIESAPSEQIVYSIPTTPAESTSGVVASLPIKTATGGMLLQSTGTPGRSYAVQAANSLNNPQWTTLNVVTANANGAIVVEDGEPLPMRFYRTVQLN